MNMANETANELKQIQINYFTHPSWRRVISQMREIFNQLHIQVEQIQNEEINRTDSLKLSNICLEASQNYVKTIENQLDLIKDLDKSNEMNEMVDEKFKLHLIVWKLCQIIFIKSSPSGVLLIDLQEWYKSTNNIDPLVQELFTTNASNQSQICHSDNYWPLIFLAVAQGRIDTARHLLSFHTLAKSSSAFKAIDELLRSMPNFQTLNHLSIFEFRARWEFWQKKCIQVLNNENFSADDPTGSLETICNMLCAVEKTFLQLKHIFNSWYYMLISYMSYANPTFNISDLHHHLASKNCMNEFENDLVQFDVIIYNIFDFDVESVIRDCVDLFSSNLFTAHLLDILYLNGKLQLNKQEFSSTVGVNPNTSLQSTSGDMVGQNNADAYHEEHLIEYATQLITSVRDQPSCLSMYETAFDYLLKCNALDPAKGLEIIESHMNEIQVRRLSELEANKLFYLAFKFGLDDVAYQIGRSMQMRAFRAAKYGTALDWNVRIKDVSFGNLIAERILDDYFKSGNVNLLELTDNLSKEIVYCDRLIFLAKYREFLNLSLHSSETDDENKMKDYNKAATIIIELLDERGLVPFKYKRRVIFDAAFLLSKSVFTEEQLVSLLRIIQNFENRLEFFYNDSYAKTNFRMRPELYEAKNLKSTFDLNTMEQIEIMRDQMNLDDQTGQQVQLPSDSDDQETINKDNEMNEPMTKCGCDVYDKAKWNEMLVDIGQQLASVFVKRPINLEVF